MALLKRRARAAAVVVAAVLVVVLPLIGLVSLLLRSQLDPHLENYGLHFVVFGIAGSVAFVLGYAAGEAANRRGDARVLQTAGTCFLQPSSPVCCCAPRR